MLVGLALMLLDDLPPAGHPRQARGGDARCPVTPPTLVDVEPRPGVAKPDPILVGRRRLPLVRRAGRGRRRPPRGPARRDHRAHRTERRRQDDAVQPAHRLRQADARRVDVRRHGRSADGPRTASPAPGMVRTFQLTKALGRHDRARQHEARPRRDQAGEHVARQRCCADVARAGARSRARARRTLLERFGLAAMRDDYAGTLSGGQRKLLEMARALMVEPKLVMLDEPMAGVNPALVRVAARPHPRAARPRDSPSCSSSTTWTS